MNRSDNTILITGGGSGIGLAIAHRFHDLGNDVIIAGRRQKEIDKAIAGRSRMSGRVLDITDGNAIVAFAAGIVHDYPALNIIINNAGIMRFEDIATKRDLADAEMIITTNLLGPIRLIDALIDHLTTQLNPAIVNLSSGLAFVPLTASATYSASKAALHFYTVSLREALHGIVEVIEIVPPGVQTDLTPGQSSRQGYMPLSHFVDEVFAIIEDRPTPPEILVEKVKMQRFAERENRFDATLKTMNEVAEKTRQSLSKVTT